MLWAWIGEGVFVADFGEGFQQRFAEAEIGKAFDGVVICVSFQHDDDHGPFQ